MKIYNMLINESHLVFRKTPGRINSGSFGRFFFIIFLQFSILRWWDIVQTPGQTLKSHRIHMNGARQAHRGRGSCHIKDENPSWQHFSQVLWMTVTNFTLFKETAVLSFKNTQLCYVHLFRNAEEKRIFRITSFFA